jgi:hypothetical protein
MNFFSTILSSVLLELLEKYLTPSKIISSFEEVKKIVEWEEEKINRFEQEKTFCIVGGETRELLNPFVISGRRDLILSAHFRDRSYFSLSKNLDDFFD